MSEDTGKLIIAGLAFAFSAATYIHHKMTTVDVPPPGWTKTIKASVWKHSCSFTMQPGTKAISVSRSGTELPGPLRAWRTESYCYVRDTAGTTCLYGRSDKIRSCWVKKQDADKAPQW